MNKKIIILLASVFCLIYTSNFSYSQSESEFEENLKILTEKNIFSVNRWTRKVEPRDPSEFEVKPRPKKYSSYILIGISSINDQWNAFFENIITGHCQIVKAGDEFEGGIVDDIDSNGVSYNRGDEVVVLIIGADMKGQTEVPYDEAEDAESDSGSAEESSSETDSSEGGSVLQKLLERRNNELK